MPRTVKRKISASKILRRKSSSHRKDKLNKSILRRKRQNEKNTDKFGFEDVKTEDFSKNLGVLRDLTYLWTKNTSEKCKLPIKKIVPSDLKVVHLRNNINGLFCKRLPEYERELLSLKSSNISETLENFAMNVTLKSDLRHEIKILKRKDLTEHDKNEIVTSGLQQLQLNSEKPFSESSSKILNENQDTVELEESNFKLESDFHSKLSATKNSLKEFLSKCDKKMYMESSMEFDKTEAKTRSCKNLFKHYKSHIVGETYSKYEECKEEEDDDDDVENRTGKCHPNRRLQLEKPNNDFKTQSMQSSDEQSIGNSDYLRKAYEACKGKITYSCNKDLNQFLNQKRKMDVSNKTDEPETKRYKAMKSAELWVQALQVLDETQENIWQIDNKACEVGYEETLRVYRKNVSPSKYGKTFWEKNFNEKLKNGNSMRFFSEFVISPARVEVLHQKLTEALTFKQGLQLVCEECEWPQPVYLTEAVSSPQKGFMSSCRLKAETHTSNTPGSNELLAEELAASQFLEWLGLRLRKTDTSLPNFVSLCEDTYF